MKVGSLFSGIGGLDLGFERAGFEIAWQVEIDDYCTKVLQKHWPSVPKYKDVRDVGAANLEWVDVIVGGFPCQDISSAGNRAGIEGAKSGLWGEFVRIIRTLRPRYVVVENVSSILFRGLDRVLADLASCGFDAEWQMLPAVAFSAPHRRDRLFLVAYPRHDGASGDGAHEHEREREEVWRGEQPWGYGGDRKMAYPERQSLAFGQAGEQYRPIFPVEQRGLESRGAGHWDFEPNVGRVANGVPKRVDRLRGLGNAVVPQVAEYVAECVKAHANNQIREEVIPTWTD